MQNKHTKQTNKETNHVKDCITSVNMNFPDLCLLTFSEHFVKVL